MALGANRLLQNPQQPMNISRQFPYPIARLDTTDLATSQQLAAI
jgi:hypothetical protein